MSGFYSVRTSTPNTWAYQMFPGGTPYSITNPQDSIGNRTDIEGTNFGYTADFMERNSVAMMNYFEQMYNQYQAQIAEWSKNTYPNISANTNFTVPFMPGMTPGVTPGRYSSTIEDSQVAAYISRLGSDPLYGSELKKKVTLDNGTEVTYLKRLDDLIKDYFTAKTPLLSAEDFAKIKEIAGKLAKTGKITKEDFLTLKKIVDNNKGELGIDAEKRAQAEADKKAQDPEDQTAKEEAAKAPVEKGRYATDPSLTSVNSAAQSYFEAMNNAGTDLDKMDSANALVTKYNVMEVIGVFQAKNSTESGESLIEMIIDDFDDYGGGRSQKWYHFGCSDDNMKPYVDRLAGCMYERANDLLNLKNANGDSKLQGDVRTNLQDKVKALQTWQQTASKNLSDDQKNQLKLAFTDLVNEIKNAEKEAYGEDAVYNQYNSTLVNVEAEYGVPQ